MAVTDSRSSSKEESIHNQHRDLAVPGGATGEPAEGEVAGAASAYVQMSSSITALNSEHGFQARRRGSDHSDRSSAWHTPADCRLH
jgi:hypothetical protein